MNMHDAHPYISLEKKEAIAVIDELINDVSLLLTIDRWEKLLIALSVALPESSLVVEADEDDEWYDSDTWPLDDNDNEDTTKTCKCGKS